MNRDGPRDLRYRRNHVSHNWTGGRTRKQYIALLDCVGTQKTARDLMEAVLVWPDERRPPNEIITGWELDWMEGKNLPEPKDIEKMRRRLMAFEEWGNREAIRAVREALKATAQKARDGTLEVARQVSIKYLTDGLAMTTRDTAIAYSAPKASPTMINKLTLNVGNRPPKKLPAPRAQIIDAEVKELPLGG